MIRTSILVLLLALTFTLAACTRTPTAEGVTPETHASAPIQQVFDNGTVVDGIRLGIATDCAGPDCDTRVQLATADAMSRHDLAASAIGRAHFYLPYVPPGATLGSGGGYIVVLDLDDGRRAAVYTFCFTTCGVVTQPLAPLTLTEFVDHGPLVDPLVEARLDCSSPEQPTCTEAVQVAIAAATTNGFIAPATIADTHYYVVYVTLGSPEAEALKAEYIVHFYIAGDHDNLAESAIGVYCGSGPCQSVPLPDSR